MTAKRPDRVSEAPAKTSDEPPAQVTDEAAKKAAGAKPETGGPAGPEPTRYGDWEKKGRCIDF